MPVIALRCMTNVFKFQLVLEHRIHCVGLQIAYTKSVFSHFNVNIRIKHQ